MKSGLEDRNNLAVILAYRHKMPLVSMKSGLEDRNNMSDYTGELRQGIE